VKCSPHQQLQSQRHDALPRWPLLTAMATPAIGCCPLPALPPAVLPPTVLPVLPAHLKESSSSSSLMLYRPSRRASGANTCAGAAGAQAKVGAQRGDERSACHYTRSHQGCKGRLASHANADRHPNTSLWQPSSQPSREASQADSSRRIAPAASPARCGAAWRAACWPWCACCAAGPPASPQ
jgi:hypothetical protein